MKRYVLCVCMIICAVSIKTLALCVCVILCAYARVVCERKEYLWVCENVGRVCLCLAQWPIYVPFLCLYELLGVCVSFMYIIYVSIHILKRELTHSPPDRVPSRG